MQKQFPGNPAYSPNSDFLNAANRTSRDGLFLNDEDGG